MSERVWTNTQQGAKDVPKINVLPANLSKYAISHTYTSYKHTPMPLFWKSFNKLAPFHTSWQQSLFFIDKIPMIKAAFITLSALLILNHGRMYTNVADGNCLFQCYSFQFIESEGKHMQLRFFFFVLKTSIAYLFIQSSLTPTLSMEDAWLRSSPAFFVNFSHAYVLHTNSYQNLLLAPTNASSICPDTWFRVLNCTQTLSKSLTRQDFR